MNIPIIKEEASSVAVVIGKSSSCTLKAVQGFLLPKTLYSGKFRYQTKLMVINIGDLWDRPIPIADEKLLLPSIYSDIECTESERITFRSYNRESYQSHQGYDASDSIYFKSLSPEVCYQAEINVQGNGIGYLGSRCENNIKECDDNNNGEEIPPARPKGSSHEVSTDLEGEKDDLNVDIKKRGGAGKSLCPHASKALRVRSSTAKDRHSKVSTAKGLRDRRVRLSVATAVRFYDIQDRLGFDHPSKALDWLMSKAISAIDELPEPSYIYPLNCSACNSVSKSTSLDPDFISTSGANTKAGYSDDSLQAKKLTQINGSGGACVRNSTKAVNTRKSIAEIGKSTKEREEAKGPVTMQSGSRASKPSVRGTSSKLKALRSGKHSGGTKIAMLDCSTRQENCADAGLNIYGNANQLLPAVYTSSSSDIAMSTTYALHEDLEICWKAVDMIHGNTNSIASFETYIRTCASSSHGIDNMLVDPDLSSCSFLNVFNGSGISQLTSRPSDVSSTSSSSSECEHSAPRIQAW